jgi:protein-tyrosine phosphatase
MSDDSLRVDWLPPEWPADGRPGRLGLTILPGKHGASTRYPGRMYDRDLASDLRALREAGVVRLVLLVDDDELARWGEIEIVAIAEAAGVEVIRRPMPDGQPPSSQAAMDEIVERIDEGRSVGHVAVACMGGVGRTGTVVACALVAHGVRPDRAIRRVRAVRHPQAVETDAQERFVRAYARHRSGAAA